ncbi:hypothetical protein NP493_953g00016 [Ridgeia piscesae]|nr:hypothetical protein NP493_953g00016 [Ridgeia piscesae]
MFIHDRY